MFCPNCGNSLPDDAAFCGKCGSSVSERMGIEALVQGSPARQARSIKSFATVSSASDKRPIQTVRFAAVVLVVIMLLTGFMPWFVPTDQLSLAGSAVTGITGLFSGGELPSVSFADNYGLWQMFMVIGEGQKFAQYMGSDTLGTYFMLYWIPFALYVFAIVLGIVGIVKTFGRNGGKAALVCSALVMLLASIAALFVGTFFQSSYVETIWPTGLVAGLISSLVALVVSAASRGKAKEQELAKAQAPGGEA